jgi:hypothetical protein
MENEAAATANNPTDASATSTQAPATSTATAATETGKQTPSAETQTPPATETPATATTSTPAATTATSVVPEKYEFKAPEGSEYDAKVIEAFSGAAKEAKLSQETAQKLIETMAPAMAARQAEQIEAIHEQWRSTSAADPEIGGTKFQENLGVAKKAYDNFATPELRKLLDDTGMGNHPEVIRMMFRVGKAISEDKVVVGNTGNNTAKPVANILYDKTK